uniref:WGS project CAEQ00000000 data, annotated contig 936 n=1 Tax=Trypanosoma congolense (strain IL3000) TaxID=1068625 RepID=F9WJQ4_TRYCI|nr:unnamed protein product [Trypanosoma congolense IL3000]
MRFLLVLLISTFIIAVALVVSHERMPDPKVTKPLPDLGFELLTFVPRMYELADLSIGCLNVLSVFTSLKLYLLHRQAMGLGEVEPSFKIPVLNRLLFSVWMCKEHCSLELRNVHLIAWIRFVTSYSLLLLFRSVVIVATSLPTTGFGECQDPPKITNPLKNIILTVITAGGGSIHCGDLMFSGHTVILTLHLMFQWVYGSMVHWVFRPVSLVVVIFSFYCIIASRFHYTDDVLVALYLTVATFIAIGHSPDGAPWQLQLFIRWWPCCGSNVSDVVEDSTPVVVAIMSDDRKEVDHEPGVEEGYAAKGRVELV